MRDDDTESTAVQDPGHKVGLLAGSADDGADAGVKGGDADLSSGIEVKGGVLHIDEDAVETSRLGNAGNLNGADELDTHGVGNFIADQLVLDGILQSERHVDREGLSRDSRVFVIDVKIGGKNLLLPLFSWYKTQAVVAMMATKDGND